MPPLLHARLFGTFSLTYGEEVVTSVSSDRLQSLLVYLLLHRDTPQSRLQLAFLLWPDTTDAQARSNLRNLLHNLRRSMPRADEFLDVTNTTVQWRPEAPFTLDVAEFETAIKAADRAENRGDDALARQELEQAVSLYQGDLMPGCYDDWLLPLREGFRQTFQAGLEHLVDLLEEVGDYRAATRFAQRLVQFDPLQETSYVQLMHLHSLNGDRAAIRRVYESCVNVLKLELDVEPSRSTQEAFEKFLRVEPTFQAAPIPQPLPTPPSVSAPLAPPTLAKRVWTLPPQPTPFIGREEERLEIAALLNDPICRLLTLVGPGGMGKTRLALRAAEEYVTATEKQAAFVSLAPVSSVELLIPTIAEALGLTSFGGGDIRARLLTFLQEQPLLLVLDNFEHLLDGVELLIEILQQDPEVKLLVTSRERLNLHEEWVFDLPGLPVPESGEAERLEENSAVALFLQSARRAHHTFALAGPEREAVVRICQMVGGMPLGIELAAAWARMLSPTEIAAEIERSMDFLVGSQRNAPERHRSLRAVFDHSWSLLSPAEQRVLRRLSLFRGGFTREATEMVVSASLPILSMLVDKSLLHRPTNTRYDLHELVRQYAAMKLHDDAQEKRETAQRHSRYYIGLLHQSSTDVGLERDNLWAGLTWLTEYGTPEALGAVAPRIRRVFMFRGWLQQGAAIARQACDALGDSDPETTPRAVLAAKGQITMAEGLFLFRQGKAAEGQVLLEESCNLLQSVDDQAGWAEALTYLGYVSYQTGNSQKAIELLQEGLELARQAGDQWTMGFASTLSGLVRHVLGDSQSAARQMHESLAIWRALGDPRGTALCLSFYSLVVHALGHISQAKQFVQESLEISKSLNDRWNVANALNHLALFAQVEGNFSEANVLYRECLALYQKLGDRWNMARTFISLSIVAFELGAYADSWEATRQTMRLAIETKTMPLILSSLNSIAALLMKEGAPEQAIELLVYVRHHTGGSRLEYERAERLLSEFEPSPTTEQLAFARSRLEGMRAETLAEEILRGAQYAMNNH